MGASYVWHAVMLASITSPIGSWGEKVSICCFEYVRMFETNENLRSDALLRVSGYETYLVADTLLLQDDLGSRAAVAAYLGEGMVNIGRFGEGSLDSMSRLKDL